MFHNTRYIESLKSQLRMMVLQAETAASVLIKIMSMSLALGPVTE